MRIERGLFSKVKDSIEVFRIDHFDLHKPLGMGSRAIACCTCARRTRASDVILYGIPNLEQLADTLRNARCANARGDGDHVRAGVTARH